MENIISYISKNVWVGGMGWWSEGLWGVCVEWEGVCDIFIHQSKHVITEVGVGLPKVKLRCPEIWGFTFFYVHIGNTNRAVHV